MENQMQEKQEDVQPAGMLGGQNEYGYFDAFGDAFQRIWKNRILWVWGIFLTIGGSSFMSDSREFGGEEMQVDFWERFWWIVPIAIGVGFLVLVGFWIVSTIVRPGVIRALDRLQNNPSSIPAHRDIWEQGKMKFIEIIKLDLIILLINLGIIISFVILAIIVALIIGVGTTFTGGIALIALAVLLGLAVVVALVLSVVVANIIRMLGTVYLSLSEMNWQTVLKRGYRVIKDNKMETFKLILINILITFIGGVVGMIVVTIVSAILIGISIAVMSALKPLGIFLMIIAFLIVFALFLLLKSFISLWTQDVVIWWVKKMQGVESPREKKEEEKETKKETESEEVKNVPEGELVMESKK